jgi:uncharacterized protein (TIGR03032 family)
MLQERVTLVLACSSPTGLIFISAKADGAIFSQNPLAYAFQSISASPDGTIWAYEKNFFWKLENISKTGGYESNIAERLYVPRQKTFVASLEVSDMAVDGNGKLLMASRAYSCIGRHVPDASFEFVWKPDFISQLVREDRCGLSGLGLADLERHCVTVWGTKDKQRGWKGKFRRGGAVINLLKNTVLAEGLCLPRCPRWYREELYLLNSGTAELGKLNLQSRRFEPICQVPGYPTALAIHDNWAVISICAEPPGEFAGIAMPAQDEFERRKARPFAGAVFVDLRTGDIAHHLSFDDQTTRVQGLAVLADCPSAVGISPESSDLDGLVTMVTPVADQSTS